jgi:hypothetical protein
MFSSPWCDITEPVSVMKAVICPGGKKPVHTLFLTQCSLHTIAGMMAHLLASQGINDL